MAASLCKDSIPAEGNHHPIRVIWMNGAARYRQECLTCSMQLNPKFIRSMACFISTLVIIAPCLGKPVSGYWEGRITHSGQHWQIAVEFDSVISGTPGAFVDFIEVGGYRRQFTLLQRGDSIFFSRQQPNGRPPLIFHGRIARSAITGSFEGIGIKGASFTLTPARKPAFREEAVVFYNDTVKLSGTLLTPAGKGPFAAVVITHGSGPDTREPYYGIAMSFVKKGVAALIYDKRGVGQSTGGNYAAAGISDLARDALAGLRYLAARPQVHPKRIGVFGHSQGGWIAPMAAALSADAAFVITSAASAVNAAEQSVYHRANVMRREGFDEAAVEKAAAIRTRLNEATKRCLTDTAQAMQSIALSAAEITGVVKEPWFEASALPEIPYPGCPTAAVLELLFKEPAAIWQNVRVPVYAVWGKQDFIVPVEKISVISDALEQAGNNRVTIKVIPATDHSVLVIRNDGAWDFPRESPGYFSDMAAWVLRLFSRAVN